VVTYQPLESDSIETILDNDIRALQQHVISRLGDRCFTIEVTPEARQYLLERGVSEEYGARELKRTLHRKLTQPLATMVTRNEIQPGTLVRISVDAAAENLTIQQVGGSTQTPSPRPAILIVDDNHDLLMFLATELKEAGWEMLMAENTHAARRLFAELRPGAVLLDYMLGEDDGLKLGLEFQARAPETQIVIMTGGGLSDEELAVCRARGIPTLFKPFLANEVLQLIRRPYQRRSAVAAGSAVIAEAAGGSDPV
jgi:ActR/RegA family two-component response regulator